MGQFDRPEKHGDRNFAGRFRNRLFLTQLSAQVSSRFDQIEEELHPHIAVKDDHSKIAQAMIDLAHRLGLSVVAEGVETKEQLEWLKRWNCDGVQGYLFYEPLTPEQFSHLLDERDDDLQNPKAKERLI